MSGVLINSSELGDTFYCILHLFHWLTHSVTLFSVKTGVNQYLSSTMHVIYKHENRYSILLQFSHLKCKHIFVREYKMYENIN